MLFKLNINKFIFFAFQFSFDEIVDCFFDCYFVVEAAWANEIWRFAGVFEELDGGAGGLNID